MKLSVWKPCCKKAYEIIKKSCLRTGKVSIPLMNKEGLQARDLTEEKAAACILAAVNFEDGCPGVGTTGDPIDGQVLLEKDGHCKELKPSQVLSAHTRSESPPSLGNGVGVGSGGRKFPASSGLSQM